MKTSCKLNKGFIVQKLGEKISIFDPEESVIYTFNETAAYIFKMLKSGKKRELIAKAIVTEYNISNKKALEDIDELIEEMLQKRILKKVT